MRKMKIIIIVKIQDKINMLCKIKFNLNKSMIFNFLIEMEIQELKSTEVYISKIKNEDKKELDQAFCLMIGSTITNGVVGIAIICWYFLNISK